MGECQPSPRSRFLGGFFPGLVWRKRGLPSPESSSCSLPPSLTTGPTSPHECGDAGPPLGREPVASGAFPPGADRTRGLPGPAWRPSPGTRAATSARREPRWETRGARRPSGRSARPESPCAPGSRGQNVGGGVVEASGALHGRGAPRPGLPAQTFHGDLL